MRAWRSSRTNQLEGPVHVLRPLRTLPQGIDVAAVTKFLNLCKAQGDIPETVREHYAVLPHTASECIQCGACETRCPFAVDIRQNMADAAALFGK